MVIYKHDNKQKVQEMTQAKKIESLILKWAAQNNLDAQTNTARTGTVYVTLDNGIGTADVRISNHTCVAGGFSIDGRTRMYTQPHADLDQNEAGEVLAQVLAEGVNFALNTSFDAPEWAFASRRKAAQKAAATKRANKKSKMHEMIQKQIKRERKEAEQALVGVDVAALKKELSELGDFTSELTGKKRKNARYAFNLKRRAVFEKHGVNENEVKSVLLSQQ